MAAQNYMHDIRSICDVHPNLPAVLGNLDLSLRIHAHTPIDRVLLTHAQSVAKALKGIKEIGNEPLVTDAVVQSAEVRAHTIEAAHASAEFSPVNLAHFLQNINNRLDHLEQGFNNRMDHLEQGFNNRMDHLEQGFNNRLEHISDRLDKISAISYNTQIVSRNAQQSVPHPYLPLQKSIAGDGLALAQAVAHNAATRNALVPLAQIPLLGDIPPNFNHNITSYNHNEILRLIIFYNNDFGILQGDTVPSRIDRFRRFLSDI